MDERRPRERTFSPKEADVPRDDGRYAGEDIGPRPFLGRRASALRAPRHTILACRVPPFEPSGRSNVSSPMRASTSNWLRPKGGPEVAASTFLASNPPRHPVEGVRDPEGFAFTAVSPFY